MNKLQELHEMQDAVACLLNLMLNEENINGTALETFLYFFDLPRSFYGIG